MTDTTGTTIDDRGVARLTLTRPEKHNALSAGMIRRLTKAAAALGADPAVRVVVLDAEGATFCAGGDLGWMQEQIEADSTARRAAASELAGMLGALNSLPKPLIGRIQGNAFGGGVGLCAVCDVVIAAEGVRFGLTETRLGLIPATIGPYVLARIGQGAARRLFASSERFDTASACRLGLVSEVVAPEALDGVVERQVAAYLACAPGAVAAAKALSLRDAPDGAAISQSIDLLIAQWEGPEAAEGISAFFEKRKPNWSVG